MQNKGALRLFIILFVFVCLYQLSFTWMAKNVEQDAKIYANGDYAKEKYYLDSITYQPVFDFLGINFTYDDVKKKELNLGLDLKGGINVILQVSVKDILIGLANESKNPVFRQALAKASELQKESGKSYLDLFFLEFDKLSKDTDASLASPDIFGNKDLRDKIDFDSSNEKVKEVISEEVNGAVVRAFTVLRSRIDKFGVAQPNIQRLENSGRILVELPGVKDADRVKKLLQSTAKLEFWETYDVSTLSGFLLQVNEKLKEFTEKPKEKKVKKTKDNASNEVDDILAGIEEADSLEVNNPLFDLLQPAGEQGVLIGFVAIKDTSKMNKYLAMKPIRDLLPQNIKYIKFLWGAKPVSGNSKVVELYAIKSNRQNKAPLGGDVITDAREDFDPYSRPVVSMQMNTAGARIWKKMTTINKGKSIAIVLDNYVYSAPNVNEPIPNGNSQISGRFTIEETEDLANVLKAGKLPAPARIIQAEVVGPSLGHEAIDSGIVSFIIALLLVLAWMIFYYAKGGIYSNVALIVNVVLIFGVLASFGAVLTLPGIAGIVLTIGMSVDANVLIYERIKEELNLGKGIKLAIKDGYHQAYSSILDANITTLLTGIILYSFGTGPIRGFATTLIIGICTSLFCAIVITRLFIEKDLTKKRKISFFSVITKNFMKNMNLNFLGNRKKAYIISGIIILVGLGSLVTKGLNKGVDFVGGRTFIVRLINEVNTQKMAADLGKHFIENGNKVVPEVKIFGSSNQVKITTKYKIDSEDINVDTEVEQLLYKGLKPYLPENCSFEMFGTSSKEKEIGILQSIKVGPTIADDIKQSAFLSIVFSLIVIFLYILIRFRKWQFSTGAVVAVFHDVMIVLSIFSLMYGLLPFSLEIDQAFIAAILTVIGYSLNDTVVVFDRIRENLRNSKKPMIKEVNKSLNSTLSRTVNTSLTTFFVLLVIFAFGGETIRGFMFALMVGVVVGTYSSLFIATPVMVDTTKKIEK